MKRPQLREGLIELRQLDGPADAPAEPVHTDTPPGVVAPGRRLRLQFELALANGAVIDSCYEREPACCTVGDGSLLPGFEQQLLGLTAGEGCDILLSPEQAFGQPNPDNVQRFPRYRFPPDLQLSEGLMVDFADAGGYRQAGVVLACDSQWVRIDFNHPLAGKRIRFRATIIDVQPAPERTSTGTLP